MKIIPAEVGERVLSRVAMGPNGCHISTYSVRASGAKYPGPAYAQVSWNDEHGKRYNVVAHRAAWTAVHGPIPEGMTIDHTCRTHRCVRVDHMRLLTRSENARRNHGRDYPLGQSCERGHDPSERVPAHHGANAGLRCRACKREDWHRWKNENPEKYREYVTRATAKRRRS